MLRATFAATALALALPAGALASTTLTFDGLGLGNGDQITSENFSTAEVTVSQGAYSGAMGDAGKDDARNTGGDLLRFWGPDWVGTTNAVYASNVASVGEFVFTPLPAVPGWIVTLDSFLFTTFANHPQTIDIAIYEVAGTSWTPLWTATNQSLDAISATSFSPTNASSSSELRLQWALSDSGSGLLDAVAIDDIKFSVAPIPLPGALPLLLGGIGLLGAVGAARRRRTA